MSPVAAPLPTDAPPEDVAKAMLEAIRDAQHARSHGLGIPKNRELYDAAIARIWALTDAEQVYKRLVGSGPHQIPSTVNEEAAITAVSESWISMLAHYADGFLFDDLTSHEGPDGKNIAISIQAKNPSEAKRLAAIKATLEITGAKGPDGKPLVPGTKAYLDLLRAKTLSEAPPFNVPIETVITLEMLKLSEGWRVVEIAIDPVIHRRSAPPRPTTPQAQ